MSGDDNKIQEIIQFGSIFLALETNYITHVELLNWLVEAPISKSTQIAYKALCSVMDPNSQYMEDTFHFLIKKPGYLSIAMLYHLDIEIFDRNSGSDNPLLSHICDELSELLVIQVLNRSQIHRLWKWID